jgi:uncharacterized protein with FMN-binding domain
MKRVLLSITATVLGLVALLSFKSHGQVTSAAATTSSGAPPDPTAASTAAAPSSSASAASTFTGAAETTRYGVVQVRITVVGKKITNVAFAQLTAFDGRSQRINADAAPILLQETLSAQSAHIDSVSGASYTSQGYETSLQSALDQAGLG